MTKFLLRPDDFWITTQRKSLRTEDGASQEELTDNSSSVCEGICWIRFSKQKSSKEGREISDVVLPNTASLKSVTGTFGKSSHEAVDEKRSTKENYLQRAAGSRETVPPEALVKTNVAPGGQPQLQQPDKISQVKESVQFGSPNFTLNWSRSGSEDTVGHPSPVPLSDVGLSRSLPKFHVIKYLRLAFQEDGIENGPFLADEADVSGGVTPCSEGKNASGKMKNEE